MGLVSGALAAYGAVAARRASDPPTNVPGFVRGLVLLPLDVAADGLTLARLLVIGRAFRGDCGTRDEVDLQDDDAVRAWAVLLTSAAPGSLAVDVEVHDDRLVLRRHLLTRHHRATARVGHR